jgi:hypothetical protein
MHIAVQQTAGRPVFTTYFCKNAVISRQLIDLNKRVGVTKKCPESWKPASLRAFRAIGVPLFTGLSTSFVSEPGFVIYTNYLGHFFKVNP